MSGLDQVFVDLAGKHGLTDPAAVKDAVTRAYGCARFGLLTPTGALPSGFDTNGLRQRRMQQLLEAMTLLRDLLPVTGQADDLFSAKDARALAKAYGHIAGIVCRRAIVDAPLPGASRRADSARLVAGLAADWPGLTGERPTAWRHGDDHTKVGGRFYSFVCDICNIYDIECPSIDTVHRIISDISRA